MIWLVATLASPLVNPDVPVQLLDIDSDGYQTLWSVEEPTDRLCRTPVHDLDGDGVLDVLSVTRELAVVLDPLGASTTSVLQQVPESVGAVGAGGLDGDGVLDVVCGGNGTGRRDPGAVGVGAGAASGPGDARAAVGGLLHDLPRPPGGRDPGPEPRRSRRR